MSATFAFILLIGFLAGFYGLDYVLQALQGLGLASVSGDSVALAQVAGMQISLSLSALRVFLAAGAVFTQFVIVLSMFDTVLDALKLIIRPLLMLVPIIVFLFTAYNTFEPIVRSLLPAEVGGADSAYIANLADNELPRTLLYMFGAIIFFWLMSGVLYSRSAAAEVERLRAELRRCQERQRR